MLAGFSISLEAPGQLQHRFTISVFFKGKGTSDRGLLREKNFKFWYILDISPHKIIHFDSKSQQQKHGKEMIKIQAGIWKVSITIQKKSSVFSSNNIHTLSNA